MKSIYTPFDDESLSSTYARARTGTGFVLLYWRDEMKITVIVPYKDAAKYIKRCADSLRSQAGDFEFIFVNDNNVDCGEEFKTDDRFVLLYNKHNYGVSGARNTGIDYATGEWITFLDVDDIFLPNAYKKFCSVIESDPDADVHQMNHVRNVTAKGLRIVRYANNEGRYQMPSPPDHWFGVWNKLFRKEFIKGNHIGFDESLQYGEDGLFVLECFSCGAYIHHGPRTLQVVEHILENKQSLSHIKTGDDILTQVWAYLDFLNYERNPDIRLFVCEEISRLLNTDRIKRLIANG